MHSKWAALAVAAGELSAARAKPTAETALGMVWLRAEHAGVGYMSHPAVVDSSMHLSVFSSGADAQTRVPGSLRYPAARSHRDNNCFHLVLGAYPKQDFNLECIWEGACVAILLKG